MAVDNFRRVILLDDATGEDRDAIAHGHRFDLIVGDKDSGHMEACNEIADFASHFLSELRIKRRKRLIKENAVLAVGKGAGNGNALLLSARKLMGIAFLEIREFHLCERLIDDFIKVRCPPRRPKAESHVFKDSHVRPQGKVLKDKTQAPLLRWNEDAFLTGVHAGLPQKDLSLIGDIESSDHAEKSRLPAAGRTEQCREAAALDRE